MTPSAPAPAAPVRLLMAGAPDAPGAAAAWEDVLERAATGADAGILLTGAGLAWTARAQAVEAARAAGAVVVLCSRSVRDRKVDPVLIPPSIRWSSLTAWLAALPEAADLRCVFP